MEELGLLFTHILSEHMWKESHTETQNNVERMKLNKLGVLFISVYCSVVSPSQCNNPSPLLAMLSMTSVLARDSECCGESS